MNVRVLRQLDSGQRSDVAALLSRCEQADGHPALAEPQRIALARSDPAETGGAGPVVLLAYDGSALVGCALVESTALDGATALHSATALHVAVDPSHRGDDHGWTVRSILVHRALEETHGRGPVRLWVMQADDADDGHARALGFRPERDLLQMRVPLPLAPAAVASARSVKTRAFRPGRDDETWLSVNNRAFEDHPEQGGWTLHDLHERMEEDWFDPDGFLVAESEDGTGMIGSCWTKVHRDSTPVLGEIYVISVDPSRHGEGWGRALTVAGLQWMAARGITTGMLYTTASNTTAVKLYESLGFSIDHVDRSYLNG